ncbi:secondary thiamine-phosphate synthase enzyme YjbQ [Desulfitibacter alkalitolerans]|uniref:secondary thiamine-phosphate synthase enzyme YjbQ n=1 Tax=Desulfitibacter alkalitolerans TaxID=264641 RepID=UPI00047FFB10
MEIKVKTSKKEEMIDITSIINGVLSENRFTNGICVIFVPHTTCGVTINENADPDVVYDMLNTMTRIVPYKGGYTHLEGNSDAHIKASMMGASQACIVSHGKLWLGTWQGVFLCEFDGPRQRKLWLKLMS